MAPTFLPFLAFMFYIAVCAAGLIIFIALWFIPSKRQVAKKIFITILISFPCLVACAVLIGIVFLLPGLLFSWVAHNNYIQPAAENIIGVSALGLFIGLTALCALYLWYFLSRVIYKLIDNKPVSEFFNQDGLYKRLPSFLKPSSNFFIKNGIIKIAVILIAIPVSAGLCLGIYDGFCSLTYEKPTQLDLVGKYHISKVTAQSPEKSNNGKFRLEFKRDGTFELTPLPGVEICDKGKYSVGYSFDDNEISFMCSGFITTAHIDRHYNYYRIEFIIGDPDSGESIYFEKDK